MNTNEILFHTTRAWFRAGNTLPLPSLDFTMSSLWKMLWLSMALPACLQHCGIFHGSTRTWKGQRTKIVFLLQDVCSSHALGCIAQEVRGVIMQMAGLVPKQCQLASWGRGALSCTLLLHPCNINSCLNARAEPSVGFLVAVAAPSSESAASDMTYCSW